MRNPHPLRLVAVGIACSVALAGCGLKDGVVPLVEGGVAAGTALPTDLPTDGLGDPLDPGQTDPLSPGDPVPGDPGAPGGPGPEGPGPEGPDDPDPDAPAPPPATVQGTDRTGLTDDRISLAIHAPTTGAAPLPSTSFLKGSDLYWRWVTVEKKQTVLGRSEIQVSFSDDQYDPNSARAICRDLASRHFMVVGGGGTDQIQACGELAGVQRFPYFSPGVTEAGLTNPWYFAGSMTYKQQGGLLAQYIAKRHPGKRVGAIVTDTTNFDDAIDGWMQGVQRHNLDFYQVRKHPKLPDRSWYSSYVDDMQANGVEVLYMLTAPVNYIEFAQKAAEKGFRPQYVGVGVTMGLNAVLGSGCPQVNGGEFFSPFPGLDVIDSLDPDFRKAAQRFGAPSDDIALALWALAKIQHQVFQAYEKTFGNDLTREDFRALMETQKISTRVFPDLSYSPQNHFGGSQVHVLKADCNASPRQYKTLDQFKSAF